MHRISLFDLVEIGIRYFEENPEDKDDVIKAYYAWHAEEHEPNAHKFFSDSRNSPCILCGRTREQVRYDKLPAQCQSYRAIDIKRTIQEEENKYLELLERGKKDIPKIIRKRGLNGKTLSMMHHTLGYDPEVVANYFEIDEKLYNEYTIEMEQHKEDSKNEKFNHKMGS